MDERTRRQAVEIFRRAIDLQPSEREAFLLERCGNDQELLQAVRRLLNLGAKNDQFLERPLRVERVEQKDTTAKELLNHGLAREQDCYRDRRRPRSG